MIFLDAPRLAIGFFWLGGGAGRSEVSGWVWWWGCVGGAKKERTQTSRMTAVAKLPAENEYKYSFPGTWEGAGCGVCARMLLG